MDARVVRHRWIGRRLGITSHSEAGEVMVAEWHFSCTWQGKGSTFEGATIARLREDKIAYLREYATTAPLYDWTGQWRD